MSFRKCTISPQSHQMSSACHGPPIASQLFSGTSKCLTPRSLQTTPQSGWLVTGQLDLSRWLCTLSSTTRESSQRSSSGRGCSVCASGRVGYQPVSQYRGCGVQEPAPGPAVSFTSNKCGSWLACDNGLSVNNQVTDTPPSQASQLPHWVLGLAWDLGQMPILPKATTILRNVPAMPGWSNSKRSTARFTSSAMLGG